jgi:uncharacterized protein (DUF2062 family)
MRRSRFFKHLPTSQSIQEYRFLRPFSRYLHHHFLWQFNRRGVAGGVAVGLFFGIISPFVQILLAAVGAIVLRVNLPVAAFATLVTNPFTVPPIYYCAYKLGGFLTGSSNVPDEVIEADIAEHIVEHQRGIVEWLTHLFDKVQAIGMPLAIGLCVMAVVSAVVGYVLVNAIWHLHARLRWRKRRLRQP